MGILGVLGFFVIIPFGMFVIAWRQTHRVIEEDANPFGRAELARIATAGAEGITPPCQVTDPGKTSKSAAHGEEGEKVHEALFDGVLECQGKPVRVRLWLERTAQAALVEYWDTKKEGRADPSWKVKRVELNP